MSNFQEELIDKICDITLVQDYWQTAIADIHTALQQQQNQNGKSATAAAELKEFLGWLRQPSHYINDSERTLLLSPDTGLKVVLGLLSPLVTHTENLKNMVDVSREIWCVELSQAVMQLVDIYDTFIRKIAGSDLNEREKYLINKSTLVIPGYGFYYITPETGRKIITESLCGDDARTNAYGNNRVSCINNVYYKFGTGLQPGQERNISSFMQLWLPPVAADLQIAAASIPIKVKNIPYFSNVPREIKDQIAKTDSFESLQERNPDIALALSTYLTHKDSLVQAGYGIDGINFKDILDLLMYVQHCKDQLGDELSLQLITNILQASGSFHEIALSFMSPDEKLNEQDSLAQKKDKLVAVYRRFIAQQLGDDAKGLIREVFFDHDNTDYFVRYLGLLVTYPALCHNIRLDELLNMYKKIHDIITKLYRINDNASNIELIYQHIPHLLDTLDSNALSALWIGLLLTIPQDAKADNFIFRVLNHNINGIVEHSLIAAVDSDNSLDWPIKIERNRIKINLKFVFYFIKAIASSRLTEDVVTHVLSQSPLEWMLQWLAGSAKDEQAIRALFNQGIFSATDVILKQAEGESANATDLPWQVSPQLLSYMYQLLQQLQTKLRETPTCSHAELFDTLYPEVSSLYRHIEQQYPLYHQGRQILPQEAYEIVHRSTCMLLVDAEREMPPPNWEDLISQSTTWQTITRESQQPRDWETFVSSLPKESQTDVVEGHELAIGVSRAARVLLLDVDKQTLRQQGIHALSFLSSQGLQHLNTLLIYSSTFALSWELNESVAIDLLNKAFSQGLYALVRHLIRLEVSTQQEVLWHCLQIFGQHWDQLSNEQRLLFLQDLLDKPNISKLVVAKILHLCCQHWQALSVLFCLDLLNYLFAHTEVDANTYSNYGETPLMTLLRFTPDDALDQAYPLFNYLYDRGAVADIPKYQDNSSVLDIAVAENKPELLKLFFEKFGAYRVNAEAALELMEACQYNNLCVFFRQQHLDIYWAWIRSVLWERACPGELEEDADHTREERDGRHYVVVQPMKYKGIPFSFHTKVFPELVGVQLANFSLNHLIFGGGIVPGELKISVESGNIIPTIFMPTVHGYDFDIFLNSNSDGRYKEQLKPSIISAQICYAILVNWEDNSPKNCRVKRGISGLYELIIIDPDHAFVTEFFEERLLIKTILFCLDHMNDPIHPDIRKQLLALDPDAIVATWLVDVAKRQDIDLSGISKAQIKNLLSKAGQDPKRMPTVLPMIFFEHVIPDVYNKLRQMQQLLKQHDSISHIELLSQLMPRVGHIYQWVNEHLPDPLMRYRFICELSKQPYSTDLFQQLLTSLLQTQVLQTEPPETISGRTLIENILTTMHPRPSLADVAMSRRCTVTEAQQQFMEIKLAINQYGAILEGLKHNQLSLFETLGPANRQLKLFIMKQLDFSLISVANQNRLINFVNDNIRYSDELIINNSSAMRNALFYRLIKAGGVLRKIDISGCYNVKRSYINEIFLNVFNIKDINMSGTQIVSVVSDYENSSLVRLDLSQCNALHTVHLNARRLSEIILSSDNEHVTLTEVSLHAPHLRSLIIRGRHMTPQAIATLLKDKHQLEILDLSDVKLISMGEDDRKINNLNDLDLPSSLIILKLDGTDVTFNEIVLFLIDHPKIQELSLNNCKKINAIQINFLQKIINMKLQALLKEVAHNGELYRINELLSPHQKTDLNTKEISALSSFSLTLTHRPRRLWWLALQCRGVVQLCCEFVLQNEDKEMLDNYMDYVMHNEKLHDGDQLSLVTFAYDILENSCAQYVAHFYERLSALQRDCYTLVYAYPPSLDQATQLKWLSAFSERALALPPIIGFWIYPSWYMPDHATAKIDRSRMWVGQYSELVTCPVVPEMTWYGLSVKADGTSVVIDWPDLPICTYAQRDKVAHTLSSQLHRLLSTLMPRVAVQFPLRLPFAEERQAQAFVLPLQTLLNCLLEPEIPIKSLFISPSYGLLNRVDNQRILTALLTDHSSLKQVTAVVGETSIPSPLPRAQSSLPVSVAALPNGRLLISHRDGTAGLYDRHQAKYLANYVVRQEGMYARRMMALSDDEIWCCYADGSVTLWRLSTNEHTQVPGNFCRCEFANHPQGILVGYSDGKLGLWSRRSQQMEWLYDYYKHIPQAKTSKSVAAKSISALVALPDERVVVGFTDGSWCFYDYGVSHSSVNLFEAHEGLIYAMVVLPTGHLLTAGRDFRHRIWDVSTQTCIATVDSRTYPALWMGLSEGQLVHLSGTGQIYLWPMLSVQTYTFKSRGLRRIVQGYELVDGCLAILFKRGLGAEEIVELGSFLQASISSSVQIQWDKMHRRMALSGSQHELKLILALMQALFSSGRGSTRLSALYMVPIGSLDGEPIEEQRVVVLESESSSDDGSELINSKGSSWHESRSLWRWDTDTDIPLAVREESIQLAQAQETVGPYQISGWQLQNVPGDGNCFYYALAHQIRASVSLSTLLTHVPEETQIHDWLRLQLCKKLDRDYQDRVWAGSKEIEALTEWLYEQQLPTLIALVDTRSPERGYFELYDFHAIHGVRVHTLSRDPLDMLAHQSSAVIRLAHTGDHFLSVVAHPVLEQGFLREAYQMVNNNPTSLSAAPRTTLFTMDAEPSVPSLALKHLTNLSSTSTSSST